MARCFNVCWGRRQHTQRHSGAGANMERVEIFESGDKAFEFLGRIIEEKARLAVSERNAFVIGLSGGSLCNQLCEALPKINTEWQKWTLIFCDERVVPFDNEESTFKAYKEKVCSATPLTVEQFITIDPDRSVHEAAADYELKLKKIYPNVDLPKIDVLLLGIGPDGHTCSLFPGHPLLNETQKWVAPIDDSPKPPPCRVTLTYPVINNATTGIFVVIGPGKADIIKSLLKDKADLPANRAKPKELVWILDQGAASLL